MAIHLGKKNKSLHLRMLVRALVDIGSEDEIVKSSQTDRWTNRWTDSKTDDTNR